MDSLVEKRKFNAELPIKEPNQGRIGCVVCECYECFKHPVYDPRNNSHLAARDTFCIAKGDCVSVFWSVALPTAINLRRDCLPLQHAHSPHSFCASTAHNGYARGTCTYCSWWVVSLFPKETGTWDKYNGLFYAELLVTCIKTGFISLLNVKKQVKVELL